MMLHRLGPRTRLSQASSIAYAFAAICAMLHLQATPVSAAAPTLVVSPATVALQPGGTADVDIVLTIDAPTRGIQFGLKYDPTVVTISTVSPGSFYQDWAKARGLSAQALIPFKPNNTRGEMSVGGIVILGGEPGQGPTGSGPVLRLTLSAPAGASGQTSLEFLNVAISDGNAHPVTGTVATAGVVAAGAGIDPSSVQAAAPALAQSIAPPPLPSFGINGDTGSLVQPTAAAPAQSAPAPAPQPASALAAVAQNPTAAPAVQTQPTTAPAGAPNTGAAAPTPNTAPAASGQNNPGAAPNGAPVDAPNSAAAQVVNPNPGVAATSSGAQLAPAPVGKVVQFGAPQTVGAGATPPAGGVGAGPPAQQTTNAALPNQVTQTALTPRVLATPSRASGAVVAPIAASRNASSGLTIPWEVLAGIGGGVVAAGLVLYALRARDRERQSNI